MLTILETARQLSDPEDRTRYLDAACRGRKELRKRVQSMLDDATEADAFFQTVDGFHLRGDDPNEETVTPGSDLASDELKVCRYKLLEKIGEGGMGVVYMAEQTEPVSRKVALKIIKLGMDTRQVVARFEAERQALALMDHPNIAKVLDGGSTETGRPFFVMELVRGTPITEFCDKNKLTTKERIELFLPVCQAIQSAHQKGIIHRDIKPNNVLVSFLHGEPVAKVIDFGIAKATNQRLTEKTLFTNYAQMIGTPAYMSPEQAEMSMVDVDTRTDVYSLGVLLYELLTGTTPFPEKRLRSAGYAEMQRILTEEEPEKPSTRFQTLVGEKKTSVASTRKTEVTALELSFQGDLDWITMKCLDKDRRRRYETPSELATDLRRHLEDEPVMAAAPTMSYQLGKFIRKHRAMVRFAAILSTILLLATMISGTLAVRMNVLRKEADQLRDEETTLRLEAETERRNAETERDRATLAEAKAMETSMELETQLYVSDMLAADQALKRGYFTRMREFLDRHKIEPSGADLRGFEWRYLWGQSRGDHVASFQAHDTGISDMWLVQGGQKLMTSGQYGKVRLWDASTYQPLYEWNDVSSMEVSFDESKLLLIKNNGPELETPPRICEIWDLQNLSLIRAFQPLARKQYVVGLTHDGRSLVIQDGSGESPGNDSTVSFISIQSEDKEWSLEGRWHRVSISSISPHVVAFRKSSKTQDLSENKTEIRPYEFHSEAFLFDVNGDPAHGMRLDGSYMDAVFTPKGTYLAATPSFGEKEGLAVFKVSNGQKHSFLGAAVIATGLLNPKRIQPFSSDESFLVAPIGGHPMRMGVWDVSSGERVASFEHDQFLSDVAFHPLDHHLIVMTSYDQTVFCWNWKEDRVMWRKIGSDSMLRHMEWHPSADRIFTGNKSGKIMVWEPKPKRENRMVDAHTFVPPLISPQSDLVMLSEWIPGPQQRSKDFSHSLLNSSAYPARREQNDEAKTVNRVALFPGMPTVSESDMRDQYSGWKEAVYDTDNGARLWWLDLFERGLGFSMDGKEFLTLTTNQVVFRNAQTGASLRTHRLHEPIRNRFFFWREPYRQMELSPDRKLLAVNEDDAAARLISVETGETIITNKDLKTIAFVKFNPASKQLLLQGSGILELWNYERDEIIELRPVSSRWRLIGNAPADYSPDGGMLAAACGDDTVRIWNTQTGELVHTLRGMSDGLKGVAFSPDGRTMVLNRYQPELMLWNTDTWRQVGTLESDHGLKFRHHCLFSPDGSWLLADHSGKGAFLMRAPSIEDIETNLTVGSEL